MTNNVENGTTNNTNNKKPLTLFFKFKGRVRKADFCGSTIDDLNQAFFEKFPDFPPFSARPFHIMNPEAKVGHEVDDINDLYPNCVIEMLQDTSQASQLMTRRTSIGYSVTVRDSTALIMVGLPARGKTFIASKICHFFDWMGIPSKVFNVAEYRRRRVKTYKSHEFFDPANVEGQRLLLHCYLAALDDMMTWLGQGNNVGIFDAANMSLERRKMILSRCNREGIKRIIFIEAICNDPQVIEANIRETHDSSPDYVQKPDLKDVLIDMQQRIDHYKAEYEHVTPAENTPFIKIIDGGRRFELHMIQGYLPGRLVFFLMNLHISPRTIWMTRSAECEFQEEGRLGGDSDLTLAGEEYAHRLAAWVAEHIGNDDGSEQELTVWTSTLKRAIRTAQYLPHPKIQLRGLDGLEHGVCDGLTREEFAQKFPEEYAARLADKLTYRYPRGESYEDIIQRLEPVILEIERSKHPILIVSHDAPLRCLYAYLMGLEQEKCPYVPIPPHTLIALTPKAYVCEVKTYPLADFHKSLANGNGKHTENGNGNH